MRDLFAPEFLTFELGCGPGVSQMAVSYGPLQIKKWGAPTEREKLEYDVRMEVVQSVCESPTALERVVRASEPPAPSLQLVSDVLKGEAVRIDAAAESRDPDLVLTALLLAKVQGRELPVSVFQNPLAMKSPLIRRAISDHRK